MVGRVVRRIVVEAVEMVVVDWIVALVEAVDLVVVVLDRLFDL